MAFKWTAPRTWVAGEIPTAATFNSHIRDNLESLNGYVQKAADESVTSSTTLQSDDHLTFTIPQAGTYLFDVILYALSAADAAGDLKVSFTFPTGTCHWGGSGLTLTLASGVEGDAKTPANLSATSGSTVNSYGLSTTANEVRLHGVLIATASGTLTLQWAQQASSGSATTIKSGSHMTVRQVA